MKMRLIIFILLWPTALALLAATLTVEIPTADVPRVSEAFGSIYGLGHNANMTEVSAATQKWIIDSTKDYERRKNQAQYTPPPMEMQPTPSPSPTAARAMATATPVPAAAKPTPSSPRAVTPTATPRKKGQSEW